MLGSRHAHQIVRGPARVLQHMMVAFVRGVRTYPWAASTMAVALLSLCVAWLVSLQVGVPVRDPEGTILGRRMALPFVFMACMILVDTLIRTVAVVRSSDAANPGFMRTARRIFVERWWWHRMILAIVGFMAFALSYLAYRNLKSYVMLVDPRTWDPELLQLDRLMGFGVAPSDILHDVFGTGVAAPILSAIYLVYIPLVPLSVALALACSRNIRDGFVYVAGSVYCWILGTMSYYMIPSLGPFGANPRLFADLPYTGVTRVQNALIDHRLRLGHDPLGFDNVASIGGFASLHVGVVFMAMIVAWQFRRRWLFAGITLFFIPTVIATIYFGWHYIVDDIAGLFIGWFAVVSARWTVYPRLPWRSIGRTEVQPATHE
jgi:hypothetical protein